MAASSGYKPDLCSMRSEIFQFLSDGWGWLPRTPRRLEGTPPVPRLAFFGTTSPCLPGSDDPEHDESTPAETKISSYRSYGIVITDELQSYKELEPEILRKSRNIIYLYV